MQHPVFVNNCTALKFGSSKNCAAGWASPRAGLDGYGKYRPYRLRSPGRAASGDSLYRRRYRGPRFTKSTGWIGLLKENEFMLTKSREELQVF